jgi:hypothetical protein
MADSNASIKPGRSTSAVSRMIGGDVPVSVDDSIPQE